MLSGNVALEGAVLANARRTDATKYGKHEFLAQGFQALEDTNLLPSWGDSNAQSGWLS
jgi:hypothetical protein